MATKDRRKLSQEGETAGTAAVASFNTAIAGSLRKKRLHLGKNNQLTLPKELIPEGASDFDCVKLEDGRILLTPLIAIPVYEAWIHKDPRLMASLQRGLVEAAEGKISPLDRSFVECALADSEE